MKRKVLSILIFLAVSLRLYAETEGEKLFRSNKPDQAAPVLEKEIISGKASSNAYNYLGLCYFQMGNYQKSVEAFNRGINAPGTDKKILAFNQGNSYYAMGDYANAAKSYSLTIAVDPSYTKALLNRANTYLMAKEYPKCIKDYELFLQLEPNDPQRPQIEEILALLRKHAKEEEERVLREQQEAQRRKEEEERLKKELDRQKQEEERLAREKAEEEARLAEEKRRQEEEERRKLLEDVANSLQNADSTNMTSGAEDIIDYNQTSELD